MCTDYNSGYAVGDKTLQAAAYGHVKIRVTYRPAEVMRRQLVSMLDAEFWQELAFVLEQPQVGERFFEIQAQNLHDARNVKILKIHAITNKEHHR
jgi:hypothetical protein